MLLYKIIKNPKKPSVAHTITLCGTGAVVEEFSMTHETSPEAYSRGCADGRAEVIASHEITISAEIKKAQDIASKKYTVIFKNMLSHYIKNEIKNRERIIQTAVNLAAAAIYDTGINRAHIAENIEKNLLPVSGSAKLTLVMNPEDIKTISQSAVMGMLEKKFPGVNFSPDAGLSVGDVVLKTSTMEINAAIEEKIKNAALLLVSKGAINPNSILASISGSVTQMVGSIIETEGLECSVGDMCEVYTKDNTKKIPAEVVGYRDGKNLLMPLSDVQGIGPNSKVIDLRKQFEAVVSPNLLGRVIDGLGQPIDGLGPIIDGVSCGIYGSDISPFDRNRIKEPLLTGVRAIDTLFSCGKGQRMGIFSGSGVGKSSLLGMMARNTSAHVNVIALIGERGREVKDFIEKDLGEEGLKRSVVIAATSDKSPLERVHGALVATTIAEYFRAQGKDVLLMMDSVTRYAMALREIGLAAGEPPSTKGYTPSVFSKLPKLLERSGNLVSGGSITAFYTVLVEGDDMNEPVADAVRSIIDGHIVLTRKIASRNQYPAIDVTASISRLMNDITTDEQQKYSGRAKEIVSTMEDMEDLINIGAYKKGANPKVDYARDTIEKLNGFLKQGISEKVDYSASYAELKKIIGKV